MWFHTSLFQHLPQRFMKSARRIATAKRPCSKQVIKHINSVNFHILRSSLENYPLSRLSSPRAFLVPFCSRLFLLNFWHPNFNFGKLSRRSTKSTTSTAVGATFSFRFSGEQVTTRVLQRKASNGTYQATDGEGEILKSKSHCFLNANISSGFNWHGYVSKTLPPLQALLCHEHKATESAHEGIHPLG